MFDAVKKDSRYRDIQFQSIDLDQDEATADKYNVESIPTVVILSGTGAVLYNDHPPMDKAGFEEILNRFR
ncbi:MAG: thioredoxin family protein [Cyanobacteria bacterium TGS_CYA1]|nr:thioredoxin family protein [Cyanobacteria bacterium TGS_CYA1]